MEKKAHYFYALKLPAEIKQHLQSVGSQLKEDFPFKNWVHEEDYHITLAFLGNAKGEQLQTSMSLIKEALVEQISFLLTIDHIGIFGRSDSPRILWAGTKKETRLNDIRELVYGACKESGFQLETRAFHPHITLARKWVGSEHFSNELLRKSIQLENQPFTFQAEEVVLYETHLERVPKYEVKETFFLK